MAEIQDLPRLVGEFATMAKEYVIQEVVEPAKKLGWFTGFSLGAAVAWAVGVLLLAVAGMRALVELFPENPYAEALGYVVAALVLALVALALTKVVPRSATLPASQQPEVGSHDHGSQDQGGGDQP